MSIIVKQRDKRYKINPYLELVGHSIFPDKVTTRTEPYTGVHNGKRADMVKEYKLRILKDKSRFFKFYIDSDGLSEFMELSLGAQKVLMYLIKNKLEFESDFIYVTLSTIPVGEGMSRTTIVKGFYELLDRNWIARAEEPYKFWINVGYFSYGNRENIFIKHYDMNRVTLKSDNI